MADGVGVAKLTTSVDEDVKKERRPVTGAWSRHWRNDVALGRNVGCFRRRWGGSHGKLEVPVWRCRAVVRELNETTFA